MPSLPRDCMYMSMHPWLNMMTCCNMWLGVHAGATVNVSRTAHCGRPNTHLVCFLDVCTRPHKRFDGVCVTIPSSHVHRCASVLHVHLQQCMLVSLQKWSECTSCVVQAFYQYPREYIRTPKHNHTLATIHPPLHTLTIPCHNASMPFLHSRPLFSAPTHQYTQACIHSAHNPCAEYMDACMHSCMASLLNP